MEQKIFRGLLSSPNVHLSSFRGFPEKDESLVSDPDAPSPLLTPDSALHLDHSPSKDVDHRQVKRARAATLVSYLLKISCNF